MTIKQKLVMTKVATIGLQQWGGSGSRRTWASRFESPGTSFQSLVPSQPTADSGGRKMGAWSTRTLGASMNAGCGVRCRAKPYKSKSLRTSVDTKRGLMDFVGGYAV